LEREWGGCSGRGSRGEHKIAEVVIEAEQGRALGRREYNREGEKKMIEDSGGWSGKWIRRGYKIAEAVIEAEQKRAQIDRNREGEEKS
jgi:hypothetical protein